MGCENLSIFGIFCSRMHKLSGRSFIVDSVTGLDDLRLQFLAINLKSNKIGIKRIAFVFFISRNCIIIEIEITNKAISSLTSKIRVKTHDVNSYPGTP